MYYIPQKNDNSTNEIGIINEVPIMKAHIHPGANLYPHSFSIYPKPDVRDRLHLAPTRTSSIVIAYLKAAVGIINLLLTSHLLDMDSDDEHHHIRNMNPRNNNRR